MGCKKKGCNNPLLSNGHGVTTVGSNGIAHPYLVRVLLWRSGLSERCDIALRKT